jgi:hypothetical protein
MLGLEVSERLPRSGVALALVQKRLAGANSMRKGSVSIDADEGFE